MHDCMDYVMILRLGLVLLVFFCFFSPLFSAGHVCGRGRGWLLRQLTRHTCIHSPHHSLRLVFNPLLCRIIPSLVRLRVAFPVPSILTSEEPFDSVLCCWPVYLPAFVSVSALSLPRCLRSSWNPRCLPGPLQPAISLPPLLLPRDVFVWINFCSLTYLFPLSALGSIRH